MLTGKNVNNDVGKRFANTQVRESTECGIAALSAFDGAPVEARRSLHCGM